MNCMLVHMSFLWWTISWMEIHTVQISVSCITNIYVLPLRITHDLGEYKIQPRTSRYTLEGVNNKLGRNTDFKVRCVCLLNRFNCQHLHSFYWHSLRTWVYFSRLFCLCLCLSFPLLFLFLSFSLCLAVFPAVFIADLSVLN